MYFSSLYRRGVRSPFTNIGVGAVKLLGVQIIFAQISANLPEKNPKKLTSKKGGAFFHIKELQAPFLPKFHQSLPKFLLTLPKTTKLKCDLQKTASSFSFCVPFKINAHTAILRRFTHILPKFPQILPGFSSNQNFSGCDCPPCTPASYISFDEDVLLILQN